MNKIKEYRGSGAMRVDFLGLHNVAKHCAHLKEGFYAMLLTNNDLISQHSQYFRSPISSPPSSSPHSSASSPTPDTQSSRNFLVTQNMLKHKRGFFQSTSLRIVNIINLVSYAYVGKKL